MEYKESFEVFSEFPEVQYGISRRWHGSMNSTYVVGDRAIGMENRFEFLCKRVVGFRSIAMPKPVHGKEIGVYASSEQADCLVIDDFIADGCIAYGYNICLALPFADCAPVYLFDPKTHWFGLLHSGWRGTLANIAGKAINLLQGFGVYATDIRAAVGPSIMHCCFHVHADVARKFISAGWLQKGYVCPIPGIGQDADRQWRIDLPGILYAQFMEAGVLRKHVQLSRACTSCLHEILFSHRRDKTTPTKNMLGFIYLL